MEEVARYWNWFVETLDWSIAKVVAAYFWVLGQYPHFALLATLLTIVGGIYTVYRIRLGWDSTRRQLFTDYFRKEETKIHQRKGPVSRRLQDAGRIESDFENLDVHAVIDKAIGKFDKGKLDDAENLLRDLNSRLSQRITFADRQKRLAEQQTAAIHLFLGSIAASRTNANAAIDEFQKTLDFDGMDTDALKYVAEQKLVLGDKEKRPDLIAIHAEAALEAATRLLEAAGGDRTLQAEAILLQGRANSKIPNSKTDAKGLAQDGVDITLTLRDPHLNAQMHELLGDVRLSLGHWLEAESAYKKSYEDFRNAKDEDRAAIVDRKLAKARAKEKDAAHWPWPFPTRRAMRGKQATSN
jgi:hypothetical protein